jgi:hypothetical protein
MMRTKLFTLSSAVVLGLAVPNAQAAGQYIQNLNIASIGTGWGGEGLYVYVVGSVQSVDGCGSQLWLDPLLPMYREMLALLTTSLAAGFKISVYVDGCLNSSSMKLKAVNAIR